MNDSQLARLWEARFQQLASQEGQAYVFYRNMLKEHESLLAGTTLKKILRRLMREEAEHARIAERLLKIARSHL